jgi:hypothetical protein
MDWRYIVMEQESGHYRIWSFVVGSYFEVEFRSRGEAIMWLWESDYMGV